MTLKITIIEDQPKDLEDLLAALNIWRKKNDAPLQIEYFCSGENYFASHTTDESNLFILDIQLHGMTGLDVSHKLRERGYEGNILFLTSFKEYVFNGYHVRALNYLLKPVSQNALEKCLDDVYRQLLGDCFIYRHANQIIQIPYKDIICILVTKHYTDITTSKQIYSCRLPLNQILSVLPKDFIRCHRSSIINMRHIRKIDKTTITLSNKSNMQISRNYLDSVRHEYANFSMRLDAL